MRSFRARCFFPRASRIVVEGDLGDHPLESVDGSRWFTLIEVPPGIWRYRFRVDGTLLLPDPFNSDSFVDERMGYYSVLHGDKDPSEDFPERVLQFILTDRLPDSGALPDPVTTFGPNQEAVVTLLFLEGMVRSANHLAWVWTTPTGRRIHFSEVTPAHPCLYHALSLGEAMEPGNWSVSCFINGRLLAESSFTVKPLGYPPLSWSPVSTSFGTRIQRRSTRPWWSR
jgi:hypothetical protein